MAWEAIAYAEQLEQGEAMLVQLSVPVCVVRLAENEAAAVQNICSSRIHPLHEGDYMGDGTLLCPGRDFRFNLRTGLPIDRGGPAGAIPVYACKIEDGAIWVDDERQLNTAVPVSARW